MLLGMVTGLLHRAVNVVVKRVCQLLQGASPYTLARNAGCEAAFMASADICYDIVLANLHDLLLKTQVRTAFLNPALGPTSKSA